MYYSEFIDFDNLVDMIDMGYIGVDQHPTEPYALYYRTPAAELGNIWNNETMCCNGLIVDEDGKVIARPFKKFFSFDQTSRHAPILTEPYRVFDKVDGTLGICYVDKFGLANLATQNSFVSDEAIRGTGILNAKYPRFFPGREHTFLFEIVYPEARKVVDYGDTEDVILLAVVHNPTGEEINIWKPQYAEMLQEVFNWNGPIVNEREAPINDVTWGRTNRANQVHPQNVGHILGHNDGSEEGFVLMFNFPEGETTRISLYMDEYKKLRKELSSLSTKTVWECLRNSDDLELLLEGCSPNKARWAKELANELTNDFIKLKESAYAEYEATLDLMTVEGWDCHWQTLKHNIAFRKAFAELAQSSDFRSLLFCILEEKPINDLIWDAIKPEFSRAEDRETTPTEVFIG